MGRAVRSARGEKVDFDLLKIKQQIASAPKTTDVKARENFIDQKFKRRLKKLVRETAATVKERTEPVKTDLPTTDEEDVTND
jgi:hypothetical protein